MYLPWHTIGHNKQKQEIEKDILTNNVNHAYLFSGPSHVGKYTLAKEFTLALFCPNNLCHVCDVCKSVKQMINPDLLVVDMLYIDKINTSWDEISKYSNINQDYRANDKPAKTDTIGIRTTQEIQKEIHKKPFGKYKVCLIKNIDRINIEATNNFLKTIEEPPHKVIFIFTTAKELSLLPTLLSRMKIINFNLLANDLIIQSIKNVNNQEEILEYAQGRIGVAIKLANDNNALLEIREQYQLISNIYEKMDLIKRFNFVSDITENNEALNNFFEYSFYYLRSRLTSDNSALAYLIEELSKTQDLISQNVNKKLALENFFLLLN